MTTQKHIKNVTSPAFTVPVSCFICHKHCAIAFLIAKTLSNAQKPACCLYTSQQTAENFFLYNAFASPNPFCGIYKHTHTKRFAGQTDTASKPRHHKCVMFLPQQYSLPLTELDTTTCSCASRRDVALCLQPPLVIHFPDTHHLNHNRSHELWSRPFY